jgi:cytosine/adenosine deaminase-related metal-dependent hydrolase
MLPRPICLTHAQVIAEGGVAHSLRFARRILAIDAPPQRGDFTLDLAGAFVLPGLINAHDHLELNHYGRIKYREVYHNASEWIEDIQPRLATEPLFLRGQAIPLAERLFIGALKNLLAGVTTVAHHNALYRELKFGFPIRVVRRYGWAHSFYLEEVRPAAKGKITQAISKRYRSTPSSVPFMLHLAEGTDAAAATELRELEARGCLGRNTVLIHGVGLSCADWRLLAQHGVGLVWCPASNLFLLGKSLAVRKLMETLPEVALCLSLGTDSRLTGSRDLLAEMRLAAESQVTSSEILAMVTINAARLLRLPATGRIARGLAADLLILPPLAETASQALVTAERKEVWLTMIGGRPVYGAPEAAGLFSARRVGARPVYVDGKLKLMDSALVQRLEHSPLGEPGVGLPGIST